MYFVLKSLKFIYIILLYMFRTPLCPSSGASQLHMQSLVPCGAWFVVSSSPAGGHNSYNTVTTQQDWRTQRTKHHTGPETACAAEKLLMMDTMVSETCRAE